MSSFFEKLKKGMGIEVPKEKVEKIEEKPKKKRIPKPKKLEVEEDKPSSPFVATQEVEVKPLEVKVEKLELERPEIKKEEVPVSEAEEKKKKWFEPEGQLAIDVYQTENDLVIQSAIAGIKPENLDISMERDIITIKGIREKPFEEKEDYFSQECYWGPFSREIILPVEVDPNRATAEMKEGILTIRIPKILRQKKRKIIVKE